MVAPTKIIAGLALCLGMRLLPAPGASGDYRSDLAAKAAAMAAAMAPDQPHDVRRLRMRAFRSSLQLRRCEWCAR